MKVVATYRIVYEVAREAEIDDESYEQLRHHESIRDRDDSDERLMPLWLQSNLYETNGEMFNDWRTDRPLPSDFELQYVEVTDAERKGDDQ